MFLKRILLSSLMCALIASLVWVAPARAASNFGTAPKPSASPTTVATVMNGPHFISGKNIDVTDNLKGDVFVFGESVTIEGTIDGDLLVAGGHVVVKGPVTQNVRVAGGIVELQNTIGGNVAAAAGTLTQTRQAKIGGSLVAATNSSSIYGQVGGQTWLAGNTASLAGDFNQTVQVNAHTLNVMTGTIITGDLLGRVADNPVVAPNVTIKGQQKIDKLATPSAAMNDRAAGKIAGSVVAWIILSLLMAVVGGAILLALFPAVSLRLATQIANAPVASLGWGFVYLLLVPILGIMLLITVLGLPLGVILLLVYFITLILGGWLAAYTLGSKIYNPGPLPTYMQQLGQFVIGLLILRGLELIPILGIAVKILALLMSLGGVVLVVRQLMSNQTEIVTDLSSTAMTVIPVAEGRRSRPSRAKKTKKKV